MYINVSQKRPNHNAADLSIFSTSFGHFNGALGLDLWSMRNHERKSGHISLPILLSKHYFSCLYL